MSVFEKEVQNKDGLTELEILVLEAARRTDYGDCLEDGGQWSFAVCDAAGIEQKVYRGVASSLIKKGLISIYDNEGKGRSNDMVFYFTDAGKALFMNKEMCPLVGKVVAGEYKWEELYFAFQKVQDRDNWKKPINKVIYSTGNEDEDKRVLDMTMEAIIFFAGCVPAITKEGKNYRVKAVGYYTAVGA